MQSQGQMTPGINLIISPGNKSIDSIDYHLLFR